MCVIFLKDVSFNDFKFHHGYHLVMTMTHTKIKTMAKTKCFKDPRYAIFFKSNGFKDIKYDISLQKTLHQKKCSPKVSWTQVLNIFQRRIFQG